MGLGFWEHEMRQRIHSLTGDNDTGYINTFHGLCAAILQEDSNAVSYPKNLWYLIILILMIV